MCAKRRSASCKKRREFLRETHTPLWLLIGRIILLTCEKTSFAILIGRIIFFTCEKHSSLPWLARTHLHIKIYNTTFWWVFLIMYIIKVIVPGLYCSYPILNSCSLAFKHIQLFQERKKYTQHSWKVLWVVLSALFFKERMAPEATDICFRVLKESSW